MVSYNDTPKGLQQASDERYMVDMAIYRELHRPDPKNEKSDQQPRIHYLEPEATKQEHPPDENFLYQAPLMIKAYNLKRKKWVDLHLDGIREISWNTKAFESLVLNKKTKRLIQALISNQIETEKSTDLISGKGNGLIMLLHGGPGTGKTLTAESVAEIAKKPLYPVTCGDIGTKPEDVENYLESVLYLGKTWGCVVLLDEADVFLEQRSLEDLQRNALVSVFLRVLEYYEGILILTSNRVGTFDEAFKSRIQLAVHYGNLTTHQRTKIWENFIGRLRELNEEGIDFDDLEDNIEQLASRAMNGREIRNAITTARQYARWERQQDQGFKLNHKVMKEVIETAGEFDEYINTLNGGLTQEQLAKEDGIR
ncbi:AAA family ATPase [Trichoderma guizhouense]|uniref:AAA family ATPase n=1 Tax=Trichoderma guizhouense TaxID=1491466 RepID=A0A1T3CJZ0_9HYPO|nr:AAA family ATPase [Trichoderma guizhouense]